jgi:hypothetical protein
MHSHIPADFLSGGGRLTSIGRCSNGLLLTDPCLLIFHITKELLQAQRICQLLLPGNHGFLESLIASHKGLLFLLDVFSIKMPSILKLAGLNGDAINSILEIEEDKALKV